MEDIYFLHSDCILCLQIAKYKTYFQILYTSKTIFSLMDSISQISDVTSLDELHYFKNLTNVIFHSSELSEYKFIGAKKYIESYNQKYKSDSLLASIICSFSGYAFFRMFRIAKCKNLNKIDDGNALLKIKTLNNLSKLTYLNFRMDNYDRIDDYLYPQNLRILKFAQHKYEFSNFIDHHRYQNLHTLEINCSVDRPKLFTICIPTLTSLTLHENIKYFTKQPSTCSSVIIKTLCNLKYIKLDYVKLCNNEFFFAYAFLLKTMIMRNHRKFADEKIIIPNMRRLKYLEMTDVGKVELKALSQMTRLKRIKIE